jgi:GH24 family phage-related lysozyme (muramidase)
MNPKVRDIFFFWSEPLEGHVNWMYADILGLVTTGVGNLIDPFGPSTTNLPWQHGSDGTPADPHEVSAEWHHVKNCTEMYKQGGYAFKKVTSLRLTDGAVEALVLSKLDEMFGTAQQRFPDIEEWPWQAQLGLLSMFWAAGPRMVFPHFQAAALAQDWATCAKECALNANGNPGLVPRNNSDVQLFLDAAAGVE